MPIRNLMQLDEINCISVLFCLIDMTCESTNNMLNNTMEYEEDSSNRLVISDFTYFTMQDHKQLAEER